MQTDRLNMILRHINGENIADIGTDHGYIPVEIVKRSLAKKVIATDIRKGPLEAAARSIAKAGVSGIQLRLGAGLAPIRKGECDNIIIAGMGGELISTILTDDEEKAKSAKLLLLQPMNSQDMLRKYLADNGYGIIEEDIECEGFKVYNLIIAEYGGRVEFKDEFELHLPKYIRGHKNFNALVRKKHREFSKILDGLYKAKKRDEKEINRVAELLLKTEELM